MRQFGLTRGGSFVGTSANLLVP